MIACSIEKNRKKSEVQKTLGDEIFNNKKREEKIGRRTGALDILG